MSHKETIHILCPNCSQQFRADVWTIISVDIEPYLKTALVTRRLNFARCPECSDEGFVSLPLAYHEAGAKRMWCYVPEEMGSLAEREELVQSMVKELRRELSSMLGRDLTSPQTEEQTEYLRTPRMFDDLNEMVEELRQDENDATMQLLEALEALQNVDSDRKLAAVLEEHLIFTGSGTSAHLRGLAELAQARGDGDEAEYFNNLAEMLERATGRRADADALLNALAAIAESSSDEQLDAVLRANPILSEPEAVEHLRYAAAETDDENTAQFYSDVADILEERRTAESLSGLDEALQAFVEADSHEERIAAIALHPVLHTPEAIAHFRRRAMMARRAEEENGAEFFDNLAEFMEHIRSREDYTKNSELD